jgi:transposase
MYVKRHKVRRGDKEYVYLRLVESYRDEQGRVRHRLLHQLGREDELKASGQLDQLAGSFARLDPPLMGTRREVGPLLVVAHYLDRLGVVGIVDRHLPQRGRASLTTGEVVAALIANRLCAPAPLYDVAGWASGAALHEVVGVPGMLLNDDRLGRALEAFAPAAEAVRGAVTLSAIAGFGVDAARLHLDLTTLRVAGAYEGSSLVAKGWGADRKVARQVRVLQATTPAGVPLYVRPHPGDAAELTCIGAALERLVELCGPGLAICADSALGHVKNLCAADRAGLRFVVPLREATGFAGRFLAEVGHQGLRSLDYVSRRQRSLPASRRTRYRGALRPFEAADPDTGETRRWRVAYIWSSEEAASVAEGRERALQKAEEALTKIRTGLGGRYYKTRKQVDDKVATLVGPHLADLLTVTTGTRAGKPTVSWHRNDDAITAAARTDGVYALATNLTGPLSAAKVLRIYKDQPLVEVRHHDAKATLRVRPIFLHNDDRIDALVSIVGLALVVFGLIESDLRNALGPDEQLEGLLPEGRAARPTGRNILAAFQGFGLTYGPDGKVLDRLTHTQRRILELLEVGIPWPEQGRSTPVNCGKRG